MKLVKKMVMVNVAIHICKEDPKLCGNNIDKMCRFICEDNNSCNLFDKLLKSEKQEPYSLIRCKQCLAAEPGN